jgi:hypothetical protein
LIFLPLTQFLDLSILEMSFFYSLVPLILDYWLSVVF